MANNSFFSFLAGAALGAVAAAYLLSDKGKDDAERLKQAGGESKKQGWQSGGLCHGSCLKGSGQP